MLIECYHRNTYDKYYANVQKIIMCGTSSSNNATYPSWIAVEGFNSAEYYLSTLKLEDLAAEINALLGKDLC